MAMVLQEDTQLLIHLSGSRKALKVLRDSSFDVVKTFINYKNSLLFPIDFCVCSYAASS